MPHSLDKDLNGSSMPGELSSETFNEIPLHHHDLAEISQDKSMPIAVVGMSFRGPSDATSVENLWRMITEGREGWSKIPKERWNNDAFYHPDNTRHGTINVEGGHFFSEDLARFDAPFFNMTNAEAAALDPQQRLLLEGAFEAFENAGIPLQNVMGSRASCFVGSFCGDYTDMLLRDPESVPMYQCTNSGQSRAITANRVSYFFDLKGPSVTVDTACSGSLVALHLACQSLRTGDASMAVAAGVNTVLSHEFMSTMSMMKFLSPDGRCYTFDDRANGYARGEGVGVLVLKPLVDALRDHDTIQAVIRGSGSNQDGRTTGITLPSGEAQEALIRHVYEAAGLNPLETEFVEAHGTGTQAGDPTETEALAKVFGVGRPADRPLRIGSIKTNVGHMEGASGVGGVIKAVLMLQERTLLPNRNFEKLNPRIFLDEWKQKIQLAVEPWETPGSHRVSVNSFGYGGSNAHVVLEDAQGYLSSHGLHGLFKRPKPSQRPIETLSYSNGYSNGDHSEAHGPVNGHKAPASGGIGLESQKNGYAHIESQQRTRLFTLSGFDESSCQSQIQRLREYLGTQDLTDSAFLDDLAYTLDERRTNFMWKAAVSGTNIADLTNALSKVKPVRSIKKPVIGFVFTGQGAQWCGMGKELLDTYPIFSDTIDRITGYLASLEAPFSVRDEITRDPDGSQINLALYSQAMCSAVQIALIDLLRSWGITPASVTGHSSGEIAAAYAMGALSMEEAMSAAYYRGLAAHNMQKNGASKGAMMAVGMTKAEAYPYLAGLTKGKAVIACVNSPSSLTISGDDGAIDELKALLDEQGIFARKLAVEVAYHSHHMEPVSQAYRSFIANIEPKSVDPAEDEAAGGVEFFSSVTGSKASSVDLGPDYWVSNMVGQVKFAESLRELCLQSSDGKGRARKARRRAGAATKVTLDLLVEVGPHSALAGPIKQILEADEKLRASQIAYASALIRKKSAVQTLFDLAEKLFTKGYPLNFAAINRPEASKLTKPVQCLNDLPPYPWNHSRTYWAEPRVSKVYRNRPFPRTDLLGVPDRHASEAEPRWRNHIRAQEIPWVRDHKIQSNIVYPAAGYLAMAIEAINQRVSSISTRPVADFILRDVSLESAMVLNEQTPTEVLVSLWPHGTGATGAVSEWHEFRVASVSESNKWTQHCNGLVAVKFASEGADDASNHREQALEAERLREIFAQADRQCTTAVDVAAFYSHLTKLGLEYGDTFANMVEARSTAGTCLARVNIADTAAIMPRNFQYPFVIHPSTLDSILHPIFVALSAESKLVNPAIPVSIDELHLSSSLDNTAGHHLDVVAFASQQDQSNVTADIVVVNGSASPEINLSIRGLICRVLKADDGIAAEENTPPIAYNFEWAPDVDLLSETEATRLSILDDGGEVGSWKLYEQYAVQYVQKAGEVLSEDDVKAMASHHRKQWLALKAFAQDFVEKQGKAVLDSADSAITETLPSGPEGALLTTIGQQLPAILRNEVDTSSVLNADNLLETYWKESPTVTHSYQAAARYLNILGHKNPHQSILEINAGSGAAASAILEILAKAGDEVPRLERYTVTDPDVTNMDVLSHSLSTWHDLVSVIQFNICDELKGQEIQKHSYDVVILPRGLTTLPKKQQALETARTLLKPGGRLIIIGATSGCENLLRGFIFGILPEFWINTNGEEVSNGCWSSDEWYQALQAAHFSGLDNRILSKTNGYPDGYSLIIARPELAEGPKQQEVLIIAEEVGSGVSIHSLQQLLTELGLQVKVSTWANAEPAGRLCIVLSELTAPILSAPTPADWDTIKKVFLKSSGVLWVVRGGTISCPNPAASLSFGFARTVRSELGDGKIVTLDLDLESPGSGEKEANIIYELARHQLLSERNGNVMEPEFAERNGVLLIPRIVDNKGLNKTISTYQGLRVPELQPLHQPGRELYAVVDKSKKWDTVRFVDRETSTPLPDDFISIEVRASGLTYKDLKLTEACLGTECSGVVRAIGASVKGLVVGDRVACIASGSVSNSYRDRWTAFQKIPDDMSFVTAASLPLAYCTAYYVLYQLARLTRDDKVLVLGAEDPCGQAVIDLCHLLGTDIFATVESQSDKNNLVQRFGVSDSRIFFGKDDSVIKAIRRETKNRGADVIINAAGADSEQLRLTWGCIAPYGRFVNIGNGEMPRSSRLDMGSFAKDALFASFDMANLVKERRDVAERTWADVMCLIRTKAVKGLQAPTQYSFADLDKALEYLDTTSAPGKVVVTADPSVFVKAEPQIAELKLFNSTASYMLVGGLGGIGRATATWMIEQGAKHLVFVNRSGTSRPEAQETVQALESKGATVKVCACDISDEVQVKDMLSTLSREAPPIRGVIQAAMVLRDNYIEKLAVEDYQAVVQPKYQGTWNLHNHLPQDLDFFVMLSSISGIIGNATQSAYAAGSSFMDAFAAYRNSQGLAAVALDLGVIGDVGYLSEHKELSASMERQGFHVTDLQVLLALIQSAIASPRRKDAQSQTVTGIGAWKRDQSLANFDAPLFSHMRRRFLSSNPIDSSSSTSEPLSELLAAVKSHDEASSLVLHHLIHWVATRLSVSDDNIDPEKAPSDYGVDSLVAVELRKWISKDVGAGVAMLEIMACESLIKLAAVAAGKSKFVKLDVEKGEGVA